MIVRIRSFVLCKIGAALDDEPPGIVEPASSECFLLEQACLNHGQDKQFGDTRAGFGSSKEQKYCSVSGLLVIRKAE